MMHFPERNSFPAHFSVSTRAKMQNYYNRILIAFICPARPLTQPSYIIPTLSMRQTLAALAHNPPIWLSFKTKPLPFFFFFLVCFSPVHPPLHVDTVSLKTCINVLEIWMRSHACEHSRASMLSVLAVFRPSPTAENIPFVWTNTFKQVEPVTRREKKTYAHPLHFGNFVKFIFTNHVVKCVCKLS